MLWRHCRQGLWVCFHEKWRGCDVLQVLGLWQVGAPQVRVWWVAGIDNRDQRKCRQNVAKLGIYLGLLCIHHADTHYICLGIQGLVWWWRYGELCQSIAVFLNHYSSDSSFEWMGWDERVYVHLQQSGEEWMGSTLIAQFQFLIDYFVFFVKATLCKLNQFSFTWDLQYFNISCFLVDVFR